MAAQPQSAGVKGAEGVPVSLKLLFKLGVGAVRQSILARIISCCVRICVMHVFVSLFELCVNSSWLPVWASCMNRISKLITAVYKVNRQDKTRQGLGSSAVGCVLYIELSN